MSGRIRTPFQHEGLRWVCVSVSGSTGQFKAYRLGPLEGFPRPVHSYAERVQDAAAAREDPNGFYDGVLVRWRGRELVLCGPPLCFEPSGCTQPGLFDRLNVRQVRTR